MKKYNFVYKTINLINGKYYIGVHGTDNLNDGYLGSGNLLRQAILKYGKENFKLEILKFFNSYDNALEYENKIITPDLLKSKKCYNLRAGGLGGNTFSGKTHTKEVRKIISESNSGKIPWNKGKKLHPETIEKLKKVDKSYTKTDKFRLKMSQATSGRYNGMYGKTHTKEVRDKLSSFRSSQTGIKSSKFKGYWVCGNYGKFESQRAAELFIGKRCVRYRCLISKSECWKDWYFQPK